MNQERGLSLPLAILININIMIGAGIFMNTTDLAKYAGALGFLCYLIIGILLLPLIFSIAALLRMHPAGGFYTYGKEEISPLGGFISSWSYFIGKLASGTILLHTAVLIFQQLIPALATASPFLIDGFLISIFVALNLLDVSIGGKIQALFLLLKLTPILTAIILGASLFDSANVAASNRLWEGIPNALPLVVFAMMGFEVATSISSKIKNPRINAPRAIFISYSVMVALVCLYQFFFYGALGPLLAEQSSYRDVFPLLLSSSTAHGSWLASFLNGAIACSALGASYGIMFSNVWNLHTLATHKHILGYSLFTRLNRNNIPAFGIMLEGIVYLAYLMISQGTQKPLMLISVLGTVLAYTISVIALLRAIMVHKKASINLWIPALGAVNCAILLGACIRSLILNGIFGISALCGFVALLTLGMSMFLIMQRRNVH